VGVAVTFDYAAWLARYPEFIDVDSVLVTDIANNVAPVYLRNDGFGEVGAYGGAMVQDYLLKLVVAHLVQLFCVPSSVGASSSGVGSPQLVGRITNATEGSVSVQVADIPVVPGTNQPFWAQTKYGLAYWTATSVYRTMHYRRPRPRSFEPWPGQGGWGIDPWW
jgi:hypothetical protein